MLRTPTVALRAVPVWDAILTALSSGNNNKKKAYRNDDSFSERESRNVNWNAGGGDLFEARRRAAMDRAARNREGIVERRNSRNNNSNAQRNYREEEEEDYYDDSYRNNDETTFRNPTRRSSTTTSASFPSQKRPRNEKSAGYYTNTAAGGDLFEARRRAAMDRARTSREGIANRGNFPQRNGSQSSSTTTSRRDDGMLKPKPASSFPQRSGERNNNVRTRQTRPSGAFPKRDTASDERNGMDQRSLFGGVVPQNKNGVEATLRSGPDLFKARRLAGMEQLAREIRDTSEYPKTPLPQLVQGGSLQTWSVASPAVERVQILLETEGRPLNADVELWEGPQNSPQTMKIYIEDGSQRALNVVMETPGVAGGNNAVAVRNTNSMQFPLAASVQPANGFRALTRSLDSYSTYPRVVQGGSVQTYPFEASVDSVKVLLMTDGRPLEAKVELLQGPNNVKQVMELYSEDGLERPFFAVIETAGSGNVVRIVNTAAMEFPLTASVEPYRVEEGRSSGSNNYEGEELPLERRRQRRIGGTRDDDESPNKSFFQPFGKLTTTKSTDKRSRR